MFQSYPPHSSITRLAKCKDQVSTSGPLKQCLIIHGEEPSHFFKCIFYEPYEIDDEVNFLYCVDSILGQDLHDVEPDILLYYDLVVFPLHADLRSNEKFITKLKQLASEKRIAILFLRGVHVPLALGYLVDPRYADYADGVIQFDLTVFNQLCEGSEILPKLRATHQDVFVAIAEHPELPISLNDQYIFCVDKPWLIYEPSKWYIIANCEGDRPCFLIHKEQRVMFTPWYGFSHGDYFAHDLVKYFCKYLLGEHLAERESKLKSNLFLKLENRQLLDVVIVVDES
ncbi:hypothetical protein C9374_005070 [Naegleria lovaniensis]|uniref:Uncharacterized protein n=1 Tax=Naegleria lovaniensis TaxID=51637 RepID=A0AA88KKB0_NAELO|nr:uncharacterized protein C9374_005070 [Naegleria lovaniensis]KAG2382490.1 hypothetical protein C9374_005070 [Naegleria lovaniensis]